MTFNESQHVYRPNKKREYKNKKFGHGGQKKRSKFNTAKSAADMSEFNPKVNNNKKPTNKKVRTLFHIVNNLYLSLG